MKKRKKGILGTEEREGEGRRGRHGRSIIYIVWRVHTTRRQEGRERDRFLKESFGRTNGVNFSYRVRKYGTSCNEGRDSSR